MLKQLYLIFISCVLVVSSIQAKTYIRDYSYKASDIDSKVTSRANALDQVKLVLLQEIGTHIRQEISIRKDNAGNTYASEDVEAITAGFTQVEIMEEKWNGETYYLKAKLNADTERVLKALEDIKNENTNKKRLQIENYKKTHRELQTAREEIEKLKQQLVNSNSEEKEKIVIKYIEKVKQLSYLDMYRKAYRYAQEGQFEDAVYWYRKAAELGYLSAQYNLALMYKAGKGAEKNNKKAVFWYHKAAEKGFARAQNNLAVMYKNGEGVEQNHETAAALYLKAAKVGYVVSQYNIALQYRNGEGVKQNDKKAIYWFTKAAEQNDAASQYYLGYMYSKGLGVDQSNETAFLWYQKSARQGDVDAQFTLGLKYENGEGVEYNNKKAAYWYNEAAEQGDSMAQYNLGVLYLTGDGVEEDANEALSLFKVSCNGGYEEACSVLD